MDTWGLKRLPFRHSVSYQKVDFERGENLGGFECEGKRFNVRRCNSRAKNRVFGRGVNCDVKGVQGHHLLSRAAILIDEDFLNPTLSSNKYGLWACSELMPLLNASRYPTTCRHEKCRHVFGKALAQDSSGLP